MKYGHEQVPGFNGFEISPIRGRISILREAMQVATHYDRNHPDSQEEAELLKIKPAVAATRSTASKPSAAQTKPKPQPDKSPTDEARSYIDQLYEDMAA